MKKWIGILLTFILIGAACYYFFINRYDALLISGEESTVERFIAAHKSDVKSSNIYTEKLFGKTDNKIHADVRILSKTTAEQLIKNKMLQKQTDGTKTVPVTSLPTISQETGIVYSDNKEKVQEIKINNHTLTLKKGEGELGIGKGRNQETQNQLIILDDSVYKELPLIENTFAITHFNFQYTLAGAVETAKKSVDPELDLNIMGIKTKK